MKFLSSGSDAIVSSSLLLNSPGNIIANRFFSSNISRVVCKMGHLTTNAQLHCVAF